MKTRLSSLFVLCVSFLFAQEPAVPQMPDFMRFELGHMVRVTEKEKLDQVIATDESNLVLLKMRFSAVFNAETYFIQSIDLSTQKETNVDIEFTFEKEDIELKKFVVFDERLYLVGSSYDKKLEKKSLDYFEVNLQDGSLKSKQNLVSFETPKERIGDFVVRTSKDGSKVAACVFLPSIKGKNTNMALRVYDKDFGLISKSDASFFVKDDGFQLESAFVSNEGVVALMFEEVGSVNKKTNSVEGIVVVAGINKEPVVDRFKVNGISITDGDFGELPNGNLQMVGFNGIKPSNAWKNFQPEYCGARLFWATIVVGTGTMTEVQSARIPKEYFAQHLDKSGKTKLDKDYSKTEASYGLKWGSIRDVFPLSDGSSFVVVEEAVKVTEQGQKPVEWFYDVAIFCLSPAGELLWARRIEREQWGEYLKFSKSCSSFSFVRGNELCILYNDHASNHPRQKDGKWRRYDDEQSKSYLVLATFSKEGTQESEVILSNKENEFHFSPRYAKWKDEGVYSILGTDGGKVWFGTLTVQPLWVFFFVKRFFCASSSLGPDSNRCMHRKVITMPYPKVPAEQTMPTPLSLMLRGCLPVWPRWPMNVILMEEAA